MAISSRLSRAGVALGAIAGLVATSLVAIVPARAADSEVIDNVTYEVSGEDTVSCMVPDGNNPGRFPARVVGNTLPAGSDYAVPSIVEIGGSEYCVTGIGDGAFRDAALDTVTLTDNITSIGTDAFAGAELHGHFEIGGKVAVGDGAFSNLAPDSDVQFIFTGDRDADAPIGANPFADVTDTDIYYPEGAQGYDSFPGVAGEGTLFAKYTPGTLAVAQAVGTITPASGTPQVHGSVNTEDKTISFTVPSDTTSIDVSLRFLAAGPAWTGDYLEIDSDTTTKEFMAVPYGSSAGQEWKVVITRGAPQAVVVKGVTYSFEEKTSTTEFPEQCGNADSLLGIATAVNTEDWDAVTEAGVLEVVQEPVAGYCTTTLAQGFAGGARDSDLLEVKLPPTILELPSFAFANRNLLENVDFGGTDKVSPALEKIGGSAFGWSLVKSADLSSLVNLKEIGASAFQGSRLSTLVLPEGLETIGEHAFGMSGIVGNVAIPSSVTTIGDGAFTANAPLALTLTRPEAMALGDRVLEGADTFLFYPDSVSWRENPAIVRLGDRARPLGAGKTAIGYMRMVFTDPQTTQPRGAAGSVDESLRTVTFADVPDGVGEAEPLTLFGGTAISPVQGEKVTFASAGWASTTVKITPWDGGDPVEWTVVIPRGVAPEVKRPYAGADRLETSCLAAGDLVEGEPLVIANGWSYADAAAGAGSLWGTNGALILTGANALNPCVKEKMMANPPEKVIIAGGNGVVSAAVKASLDAIAKELPGNVRVERLSGDNRYETAARIAEGTIPMERGSIVVTSGVAEADQATSANLAQAAGGPVVYLPSDATTTPEWLINIIQMFKIRDIRVVGGALVSNEALMADLGSRFHTVPVAGANRYETAAMASAEWGTILKFSHVALTNGADPIDGLAAAARVGQQRAPLLQTPANCLDLYSAGVIARNPITTMTLLGGPGAVSDDVGQMKRCGA